MKQTIRINSFETNSSSEHSVSINDSALYVELLEDVSNTIQHEADMSYDLYAALGKLENVKHAIINHMKEERIE
jgi:hypothetical protein